MPDLKDFTHYRIAKRPNQKWHLEGATDPSGPWHKLTKAEHQAVMPGFLEQYASAVSRNATPQPPLDSTDQ